jgi:superfamily II DNA or RNA helicase
LTQLSELIRHDQPISTAGMAIYPYKPMIERKYKFTSRFGDEVLLHKTNPEKTLIYIPRALCPVGVDDYRDEGQVVNFPTSPKPRDNQVEVFAETAAFLKAGQSGIVVAQTGWGKTYLGYSAAAAVGRKTLVITTKDDIYEAWVKDAPKALGIPAHEVGEIRGDKCEVKGTKFVVAMIHSLSNTEKYPDWIVDGFGLVIFDEVHRLPATEFSKVAGMFPAKLRLGLSARVERSDGKEMLIHAHIGPKRAEAHTQTMVPKVLRFTTEWACPRVLKADPETGEKSVVRLPHEPGKTTHIEKMLAADTTRNHLIMEAVMTAYERERRIVVFSTLTDHLNTLHRLMVKLGAKGKDLGFYSQATTKAEKEARQKVIGRRVLFTTYGMMGEGTNIPWLDTAVLAIPRSNVEQPVGRIRRVMTAKEMDNPFGITTKADPVVMDFVDNDSPVFSGYGSSRLGWYKKVGCVIRDMV